MSGWNELKVNKSYDSSSSYKASAWVERFNRFIQVGDNVLVHGNPAKTKSLAYIYYDSPSPFAAVDTDYQDGINIGAITVPEKENVVSVHPSIPVVLFKVSSISKNIVEPNIIIFSSENNSQLRCQFDFWPTNIEDLKTRHVHIRFQKLTNEIASINLGDRKIGYITEAMEVVWTIKTFTTYDKSLIVKFVSPNGSEQFRVVVPQNIAFSNGRWIMYAMDEHTKHNTFIELDRIISMENPNGPDHK